MEENEIKFFKLYDDNGDEIHSISDISLESNEKFKTNTKYMMSPHSSQEFELSLDKSVDINTLLGMDVSHFPDKYAISTVHLVQARKHKKKRINKKWAKRYGYRQVVRRSEGWELHTNTDGSFEFKKDTEAVYNCYF